MCVVSHSTVKSFCFIDEAEQIAVVARVIRCWSRCNTAFPTRSVKRKMTNTTNTSSAFRDSYNTNIEDAEKEWGRKRQKDRDQILGCLDSRIQLSLFTSHAYLDMQMQYSFDYCQQVSLPYSSQQRGTFYFRTPHKVQVFGVCCEPLSRQVFF